MLLAGGIRETLPKGASARYVRVATLLMALLLFSALLVAGTDHPVENGSQPATGNSSATPKPGKSLARAVTTADVFGTITVKKPGTTYEEKLSLNTPVQEGFEISTRADSSATVEFENDSTAIVGARSRVCFHQLALDANGNRLTGITLEHGLATFHFLPQHHAAASDNAPLVANAGLSAAPRADVYEVKFGDARATVAGKCRFRIDVKGGYVRVEVFKGELHFVTPVQSVALSTGTLLEHRLGSRETAFNLQKGIVKDPWDAWASAEEQKILSEPKRPSGRERQPENLNTILSQRHWNSSSPGDLGQHPHPPREY